jgi:hypothetical protein
MSITCVKSDQPLAAQPPDQRRQPAGARKSSPQSPGASSYDAGSVA